MFRGAAACVARSCTICPNCRASEVVSGHCTGGRWKRRRSRRRLLAVLWPCHPRVPLPPRGSCPCPPPTPHPPYVPQVEHCFVRSRVASGCRSQVLYSTSAAVIDLRCVAPAVLTVKTERRDSILEGVPAPMHLARTGPGATIPYHTHPPYVPQALCAHGPARRPQDQVHPCGLHRREALPADGL